MSNPLDIEGLAPDVFRAALPSFLAAYITDAEAARENEERVRALVSGWSDATTTEVMERLSRLEPGTGVLEAHPACRALARCWSRDVVLNPVVEGVEHLGAAMEAGPTVVLGNHLAYFDASALDCALAWAGHEALADRLVAAAGPKVYTDTFRRIAAVCLHTLPVPQSSSLAHTQKMPARELARQVIASLKGAKSALSEGKALLLYPEGSRTRTGHLGSFLRGVHRYLSVVDEVSVVPCAISGTEAIMPLEARRLTPGAVRVAFGLPLLVGRDGDAKEVLAKTFGAVAGLLPGPFRPPEGTPPLA